MDRNAVMKFVCQLEQKYPVSEWAVNDVTLWPLIRVRLLSYLYGKGEKVDNKKKSFNKILSIEKILNKSQSALALLSGFYSYYSLRKKFQKGIDVIFLSYVTHRQEVNGIYYNRFCDIFFEKALNKSYRPILIEFKSGNQDIKSPRSQEGDVVEGDNAINFYNKLLRKRKRNYKVQLECYDGFLREIEVAWGSGAAKNISKEKILDSAQRIDIFADFFSSLFKYSKPKVALCVSYYSSHAQALILSTYRNNIPSVDIQHGIQGHLHEAYGNWSKLPVNGYNLIPNYFWNWDTKSADTIAEWACKSNFHSSINGGNPWLAYWKEKNFESFYQKNSILKFIKNKKVILYTLQPSFEPFSDLIRKAIFKTKGEYIWLIRTHPRQIEQYQSIQEEVHSLNECNNIELENATQLPLPFLLTLTDIHITVYSTVAIEAAAYQVPTLFITKLGKQYFCSLLPEELTSYDIESDDVLVEELKKVNKSKKYENMCFNVDAFEDLLKNN